jgi:hypothetical protein
VGRGWWRGQHGHSRWLVRKRKVLNEVFAKYAGVRAWKCYLANLVCNFRCNEHHVLAGMLS